MRTGQHPFDEYVRRRRDAIRLAQASLLFAKDRYPDLAVEAYLWRLDGFARRVARIGAIRPLEQIAALRTVLVEEEALGGNVDDYYDPRNSYLNQVLDRRTGLPISLSVIWLDVARTLGWPFEGVGAPGHFLISCASDGERIVLDPFRGGALLTRFDLEELIKCTLGSEHALSWDHYAPAAPVTILKRMLNNLRLAYVNRCNWRRALRVVQRMLAIEPDNPELIEQNGRLHALLVRMN